MLFTQPLFIFFFFIVFIGYWSMKGNRMRKVWLLGASYVFYGAWDWRFCFLILASTIIDFIAGLQIAKQDDLKRRRMWLIVSLCANLGFLGFFKYFNFFIVSTNSFLALAGMDSIRTLSIVLPVGISFYTFQTMSYSIDIYRRNLEPIRDFLDFGLFVSFFPQLVAGPIVRASTFLPQLDTAKVFDNIRFKSCFTLFLIGFIKKACISDNVAPIVDQIFASPGNYNGPSVVLGVLFYAVQIYCDFSGYTDMAIAVAGLLGYELTINFAWPYFSTNVTEFWRRWHISLSTWLRDYLYISLGGNRGTQGRTQFNLMATMLLGGLWHGAGWNFVIWGGLHGFALIFHRLWREQVKYTPLQAKIMTPLGPIITFWWVCLAWIFFRAPYLDQALQISQYFITFTSPGTNALSPYLYLTFIPLALAHWFALKYRPTELVERVPDLVYSAALGAAVVIALMFVRVEYRPFIYFQF